MYVIGYIGIDRKIVVLDIVRGHLKYSALGEILGDILAGTVDSLDGFLPGNRWPPGVKAIGRTVALCSQEGLKVVDNFVTRRWLVVRLAILIINGCCGDFILACQGILDIKLNRNSKCCKSIMDGRW